MSTEARDGWYRFAEAHDTNVTALLEALGVHLGAAAPLPVADLGDDLQQVVAEAKAVAGRRSSRRRVTE